MNVVMILMMARISKIVKNSKRIKIIYWKMHLKKFKIDLLYIACNIIFERSLILMN